MCFGGLRGRKNSSSPGLKGIVLKHWASQTRLQVPSPLFLLNHGAADQQGARRALSLSLSLSSPFLSFLSIRSFPSFFLPLASSMLASCVCCDWEAHRQRGRDRWQHSCCARGVSEEVSWHGIVDEVGCSREHCGSQHWRRWRGGGWGG